MASVLKTSRAENLEGVYPERGRLAPQLRRWISITKECAEAWNYEDVPWWYNERAQLSLFAGAIWKTGGLVFEEFASTKAKNRVCYSGRCDIYFKLGRRAYIGEAKQRSVVSNHGRVDNQIRAALDRAFNDCKASRCAEERLAILFVTLRTHTRNKQRVDDIINQFVRELKATPCCVRAWVFPAEARNQSGAKGSVHFHPGGAILMKSLKAS